MAKLKKHDVYLSIYETAHKEGDGSIQREDDLFESLEDVLPVLEKLWEKAPWYVKLVFNLVDAIRDVLDGRDSGS